jgi:pilus assembly protein Flp/PilA
VSKTLQAFVSDESGATAIEYALLCSLLAFVIIASLTGLGTRLGNEFHEVSSGLK